MERLRFNWHSASSSSGSHRCQLGRQGKGSSYRLYCFFRRSIRPVLPTNDSAEAFTQKWQSVVLASVYCPSFLRID
ncbi:hypothetical protein P7K49_017323 [Saguinus oedipus]|uniref:Uncharacterized protein n=1 Tax=Saguinus oedipus TaxID=9490 RepID=A0ABQ9V2M6_SAGOE|nr:hypothetical protein P7K49_017323 [Saguinus oedipus]